MLSCLVYIMMFSVIPAFVGMLALALLPKEGHLWTRWGMYLITIVGNIAGPRKWFSPIYIISF